MNRIGININRTKERNKEIVDFVKCTILNNLNDAEVIVLDEVETNKELLSSLDMVISLGGDGTILSTSRLLEEVPVPIFGVNIGNLGFLTSSDLMGFEEELINIINGKYTVEDRMLLNCNVYGKTESNYKALNDLVICKGTLARIVKFDIYIDEELFTSFKADGVIVSTPTGSTAYSLSAGGPILYPTLEAISITPICPHLLGMRTLVVKSDCKIKIKYTLNTDKVFLTVDGQWSREMEDKEFVTIEAAKETCRLITTENYSYFKVLRNKLLITH